MRSKLWLVALVVTASLAAAQSFTGNLDPDDPNDVLLIAFTLSAPSTLHVQSWGYGGSSGAPGGKNAAGTAIAPGGFDAYITLFSGIGPDATFLASNDDGSCPPGIPSDSFCLDPTLHLNLPAGSYMLALSVFQNFSFAENLGTGTAGDLFIGLGNYYDVVSDTVRTSKYAIDITAAGLNVVSVSQIGVVAPPVLTKAFTPNSIGLGGTSSLVFTIENPNLLIPLTGVSFGDPLPAGLVVATPNGLSGPFCSSPGGGGGTISAVAGTSLISLSGAAIPANGSCTFSVNVKGIAEGLLINLTDNVTSIESGTGNRAEAVIVVGDPYRIRYTSNLNIGDSVINITNTGTRGAGLAAGTSASVTGALCVNVYAFSPDEQMISCCSCPVTPNGLVSLSARSDLISNTLTPAVPASIVVKLLASAPVGGSCNGSAARPGTLTSGMEAFGTTIHAIVPAGSYGVTETRFNPATLSPGELTRLTQLCTFINANGSGFGICRSCRLGGLGADKQ